MSDVPWGEPALVSGCGTTAAVTAVGSADWLRLPCFDGSQVLGRLRDEQASPRGLFSAAHLLADAEHARPRRCGDGTTLCLLSLPEPEDRSLS